MSTRGNPQANQARARSGGSTAKSAVERAQARVDRLRAEYADWAAQRKAGGDMASRAASNAPNLAYLISQVVSTGLKLDAAETALRREQAKAANGGVAPAKTPSHTGRQSAALNQATKALGPNANEPQRLRTALMEAAAERLATDPAFAARVRERYAVGGQATAAKATGQIVPIRPPTLDQYTPYGRFDPHQVMHEYGHAQFRAVLERSTMRDLKEATDFTQQRHPGTRPTSRASKAAMIDYIVANTPPE